MEITEVRVKLMNDPNDRLLGFCSVTLDGSFVIRDLKIIQGGKGPFVAMPSRRLMDRCPGCHQKNHLRASSTQSGDATNSPECHVHSLTLDNLPADGWPDTQGHTKP